MNGMRLPVENRKKKNRRRILLLLEIAVLIRFALVPSFLPADAFAWRVAADEDAAVQLGLRLPARIGGAAVILIVMVSNCTMLERRLVQIL